MLMTLLNAIASEYECEVRIGDEFAYYYSDSLIIVDIYDNDTSFHDFAVSYGLPHNISSFTISFLHELGHNETLDFVDEYMGDKNALTPTEYYSLEEELIATEWAIDFCKTHKDIVEKIEKVLDNIK